MEMENGQRLYTMCNVIVIANRDTWDGMKPREINFGEILAIRVELVSPKYILPLPMEQNHLGLKFRRALRSTFQQ